MKKITIGIEGKGYEIYAHKITAEIRAQLIQTKAVEDCDRDKIGEILGMDSWGILMDSDEFYCGPVDQNYSVVVKECIADNYYETEAILFESDHVSAANTNNSSVCDKDYLLMLNHVKGVFHLFELEIEGDFNPDYLKIKFTKINFQTSLVDGIAYNGANGDKKGGLETSSNSVSATLMTASE